VRRLATDRRAVSQDEIFHFPQTKHYCAGDFGIWDDKITTLPGLYGFGLALTKAVSAVAAYVPSAVLGGFAPGYCTLPVLRAVNAVFGLLCFLLIDSHFREARKMPGHLATWHAQRSSLTHTAAVAARCRSC